MALKFLSFGARRRLLEASEAFHAAQPELALEGFRAYFAARLPGKTGGLKGVDVDAALMAATAAALCADDAELEGVSSMLDDGDGPEREMARTWVDWLRCASRGEVDKVLATIPSVSPFLARFIPRVHLLAAERALTRLTPAMGETLRKTLDVREGPPEVRARTAVVLAAMALRFGDRKAAAEAMSAVPADAPPLFRMLALTAQGQYEQAGTLAAQVSADDRGAAVSFAAALAVGSDSASLQRALTLLGAHATPAARTALVASLTAALAREGNHNAAWELLRNEQPRAAGSAVLSATAGFLALAGEQPQQALESLRGVPRSDGTSSALRLTALVMLRNGHELVRELESTPELSPSLADAVRGGALGALASAGLAPTLARTPSWLAPGPGAAPAVTYAWAFLRLRQGLAAEAVEAFDRAIAQEPGLVSVAPAGPDPAAYRASGAPDPRATNDGHEVARLHLARAMLASGRYDDALRLAASVQSERLRRVANTLQGLVFLATRARQSNVNLAPDTLPGFVQQLRQQVAPGSPEGVLLEGLDAEVSRLQLRHLLRRGELAQARQVLGSMGAQSTTADGAFLQVTLGLLEGSLRPVDAEQSLAQWAPHAADHAGLQVLWAELRKGEKGPEAAVAALEQARVESPDNQLLEEALAALYRDAYRGVDAKRIALAAARRLGARTTAGLAQELSGALSLEAPPARKGPGRSATVIERAPQGEMLQPDKLAERVHLLLGRAARVAGRSATLDAAAQQLKRALVMQDAEAAKTAESETLRQLSEVRA